jgi:hypothetical protein
MGLTHRDIELQNVLFGNCGCVFTDLREEEISGPGTERIMIA